MKHTRLRKWLVFVVTCTLFGVSYANPVLDNVASGQVNVSQSPNTTVVNQSSQQAIINWNSFNIGAGESTQFIQPNASSVALNRINASQGASQIFGSLSANGQIILVNGAGIHFGPNSMVNVAGFIASTADISNANFLAGKYIFDGTSSYNGTILNEGQIIVANHGLVALLGHNVQNNGLIQAELGSIVLGSGNKFTLDFYGDQLVNFTVNEDTASASVKNSGSLLADGGKILVSANSAAGVLDSVINMEGVAQARSVGQQNGVIILSGGKKSVVRVSGKLDASGGAGSAGGTIKVLGNTVHLTSGAYLDASGDVGGGTILVGGNFQGKGVEQNASNTLIDAGAIISANALTAGNGGRVIVWSDLATAFHGSISAAGGTLSGDGGFVETSGHHLNVSNATIYLKAVHGKTGTWLLDPLNVIIQDNGGVDVGGGYSGDVFTPTSDDSIVDVTTLQNNLANANIEITTGSTGSQLGDITINADINWNAETTLTLSAANKIYFSFANGLPDPSYNVININGGGLVLNAAAGIEMISGAAITTTGNQIFNGPVNLSNSLYLNSTAGSIAFNAPIDGGGSISALAALGTSINADVGSVTPIGQLTLGSDVPGAPDTLGGSVHTTSTQTYNNPLLLNAANITLTSDATADRNFLQSTIKFNSSVDSASGLTGGANLTLNSPAGSIYLGNVGNISPLASLTILASTYEYGDSLILFDPINGSRIRTTGDQIYQNSITVLPDNIYNYNFSTNNNLIFAGANIQLLKNADRVSLDCFGLCPIFNLQFDVTGTNSALHGEMNYMSLIKNGLGALTLDSSTGLGFGYNTSSLTVNEGVLSLNNVSDVYIPITVNQYGQLELNSSTIDFSSSGYNMTLNGNSSGRNLLIGTGSSSITGSEGAIVLEGNVGIGGSGNLMINSSFSGGGVLTKNDAGTLTLNAPNSGTLYLPTIVNGGTLILSSSGSFLDSLTVNVGATVKLNNISIDGSTINLTGNGVDGMGALVGTGTDVALTNSAINLAADATIGTLDVNDTLLISSTIDGNHHLTLAGPGTMRIEGALGNTSALASLTANVANLILAGVSIQTIGNQTYNTALQLQNNMTLNMQGPGTIAINNGISDGGSGFNLTLSGSNDNAFFLAGSLALNEIAVQGNAGVNSLTVQSSHPQTWTINAADSGEITGITELGGLFTFNNIQNITGGAMDDTFILNGGTISGNIDGAGGLNTLIADNVANIWNITGIDSGSVTGVNSFNHIQVLTGGNTDNTFNFSDNASVTGQVDTSLSAGENVLNYSAYSTDVSADYSTPTSGTIRNSVGMTIAAFQGIQSIIFPTITPVPPVPPVVDGGGANPSPNASSTPSMVTLVGIKNEIVDAITPFTDTSYYTDRENTVNAINISQSAPAIVFNDSLAVMVDEINKNDVEVVANQVINAGCN